MKERAFRSAIPHLVALLVFTVISFAYFYPVLEGRKLNAHDTKVYQASSKEISDFRARYGKEPLWTNSMFSGMPAYMISVKYPGNLFKHLDNLLKIFNTPVAALFLSMLGFYIMLLMLRVNPWLAIAGSVAYGFTSYLFVSLSAGHNTKAYAMAYMAPVVGSVIYSFRRSAFTGAALFALFLSLQIMANHFQITYYTGIIVLIFGIFELADAISKKVLPSFLKTFGMLLAAAVIAFGVNFASLYSTWEYSKESTRGKSDLSKADAKDGSGLDKDYITQWSYGIGESLTFLIPDFRGGATAPFDNKSETVRQLRRNNMGQAQNQLFRYWGRQPSTSGPVYFGAAVLLLFVLGLMLVNGKEKWWILTAVLLSLTLSWGKNFMPLTSLFIDFFPGYDKFRAVSMTLVIAGVCIPLLAVLALKEVTEGNLTVTKVIKSVMIAAGATGGITLIFLLFPGLAGSFLRPDEASLPDSLNWLKDAMIADRKAMLRTDALRSSVLIIACATLIWLFVKNKISNKYLVPALTLLFLIDQVPVDARYLGSKNFETRRSAENAFAPTKADKAILQDKQQYRVLNLTVSTFNDASTSYHHKSIGGYSGAKMKRYQELIESSLSEEIGALIARLRTATTWEEAEGIMAATPALNMLNTKYIIISPDEEPLINRHALGNAWFADKVSVVENADAELEGVKTLRPASEAIADRRFSKLLTITESPGSPSDKISLTSYEPNLLTYKSEAASERIAVFSEIYYPYGWQAFIDDRPAEHFRVNYVLRGMIVPAGSHTITFKFEPESYRTGNRISLAGSVVLLAFLILASLPRLVTKRRND